jgi:hypothetical protein
VILALMAMAAITGPLMSQGIPEDYQEGTHIVREGDTLRGITRSYLGSEDLWQRNWELNPQVKDPDLLYPLQRLRILVAPQISRPTARLVTISGDVEGKPAPSDWNPSLEDDLMLERDGVRANKDSSTVMEFSDGSELTLKDESTVFLRVAGRSLHGGEERSVEILEGQADLAAVTFPQETEIEIVIGGAVTTPKPGDAGGVEARARKVAAGGAQVMVFEGLGEVVSGGGAVTLEEGTGTAVPVTGPPSPPERLLPAVDGLLPDAGGEFELQRSRFSWEVVEGAVSYTAEICRDMNCGDLVKRRTGLADTLWEIDDLPLGDYLWRVTAVSESGLDGYPSKTQPIEIVAHRPDDKPPTGEFVVSGRSVVTGGVTYYAADLDVRLEAKDEGTGITSISLELDGREVPDEVLRGPWDSGDYEVTASIVDASGNSTLVGPLEIHIDADPPVIDWTVGGEELLDQYAGGSELPRGWAKSRRRSSRRELKAFGRGRVVPRWTVLAWSSTGPDDAGRFTPDAISRQRTHNWFSLRRQDAHVVIFAPALALEDAKDRLADKLLSIGSVDELAGLDSFRLRRSSGPDTSYGLEVEATDRLGNRRLVRWPFSRGE